MKNKYFQEMRKKGVSYRRNNKDLDNSLFSKGESLAFKYWAIAERMDATDILIDEFPENVFLHDFIETFRNAGIKYIVFSGKEPDSWDAIIDEGCSVCEEIKVFRRESQLYDGRLQIIKGLKIELC